jgi:hypothetical protein
MLNNSLSNLNVDLTNLSNKFKVNESDTANQDAIQQQANSVLQRADGLRQELGITPNGEYDVGNNLNDSTKNNFNKSNTSIITGLGDDVISNNTLGVNAAKVNSNYINSGRGNDVIVNNGSSNSIGAGRGDDVIDSTGANNSIRGGIGNDVIRNSNGTGNTIRGGIGDDIIISDTMGSNKIRGGTGNDTIIVNTSPAGTSTGLLDIRGGSGDDTVILSGREEDYGLGVDAAGNKTYIHKASGNHINIKNDIEEIKFEQVNLLTDEPAPNQTFEQGFEDYSNTHNQLTELISSGNTAEANRLQEQLDIKGDNLLDNTESITMSYDDFVNPREDSPVVRAAQLEFFQETNSDVTQDLENQLVEALSIDTAAGRVSAAAIRQELATSHKHTEVHDDSLDVMNELIDKTQIDFGNITKDQAKFIYGLNLDIAVDLENQQSKALGIDTDAGRVSSAGLNSELKTTKHVVSELERQFGFNKEDVFPERYDQSRFFIDLNKDILSDLEGLMLKALNDDTDAGRISAADLRKEIGTTKNLIEFWRENAKFWKPN